ncbi:TorF family putative porin [Dokdonella sp.]|uniref:TorF family putative porin n=1 Tax=Dokdonella sp. TaxID=2291710 RepID=UPI0026168FC4|nr:TorF family putative porin [Dokdonella sp.]
MSASSRFLRALPCIAAGAGFCQSSRAEVAQSPLLGGSVALTSDYVWRGISQTGGDPAAQAGVRLAGGSGFYVSAWGSNVRSASDPGLRREFDLAAGWSGALAKDWALDVYALRYVYPGAVSSPDWTEIDATLTWRNDYWLSAGYSSSALGSGRRGLYTQLGARFPLDPRFRLEAIAGWYRLDRARDDAYVHAQFSAIWVFHAPFELRVSAHVTDHRADRLFGADVAGSRVEGALQANF